MSEEAALSRATAPPCSGEERHPARWWGIDHLFHEMSPRRSSGDERRMSAAGDTPGQCGNIRPPSLPVAALEALVLAPRTAQRQSLQEYECSAFFPVRRGTRWPARARVHRSSW